MCPHGMRGGDGGATSPLMGERDDAIGCADPDADLAAILYTSGIDRAGQGSDAQPCQSVVGGDLASRTI